MKQENVFETKVGNSAPASTPFSKVNLILMTVITALLLVAAFYASNTATPPVIAAENFLQANPEVRYAGQVGARVVETSYLSANPEARLAHLEPAAIAKVAERTFLVANPEARYAISIINTGKTGNSDFFDTNPEVRYAGQVGARVVETSYLSANPEARMAHLELAVIAKVAERIFLVANPEARYAISIINTGKSGNSSFFDANPEVAFNQRYLDASR